MLEDNRANRLMVLNLHEGESAITNFDSACEYLVNIQSHRTQDNTKEFLTNTSYCCL